MKKSTVLKRISTAEMRAARLPPAKIKRLISKMTTSELKEIAEGNITDKRLNEIIERVEAL